MNATLLLVIATLALVVGPLLSRVGRRLPGLAAAIDGATVAGIVVLAFVHLLPEAGAHLSWWALVLFAVGLLLPTLGESVLLHQAAQSWRFSVGGLVVVLLLLHEVIESAALASKAYDERISLATLLVIVGHRLPLGLFLWGHARRRLGLAWSTAVLAFVAAASLFGPLLVPEPFREGGFSAVLSALLAGGLLHLVLQHPPALGAFEHLPRRLNAWSAAGALAAVSFFVPYLLGVAPTHIHESELVPLPQRLWDLVLETSLPLLLGVLGAALIEAFLPGSLARWLGRGSRLRQVVTGVVAGAPLPVCSCGVLPIYRSLIVKGVPPAGALALLIAAPEIGLDSILLSLPMLGVPTTIARLSCALLLALAVGLVVGGLATATPPRFEGRLEDPFPRLPPLLAIRRGLLETWGHLSPWILFGLLVTALVEPWISTQWARVLPPWSQILVLSLAGMPSYICAAAATPFAALLLAKGFTPGAVIAFLLTGPGTNLTTIGALQRIHSRKVAAAFLVTVLGVTFALGACVDAILIPSGAAAVPLRDVHAHGWYALPAALLLGALTLWVLFREGPRGFLAQLWPEGSVGRSAHAHRQDAKAHSEPAAGSAALSGERA